MQIYNLQTCEAQDILSGGQKSKEATWSKLYNHTGNPVELVKPPAAYRVGHQNGLSVIIICKQVSFKESNDIRNAAMVISI